MLGKWKKALDDEEIMSAMFLELSQAFDTINHDLLAKLKAYGFSKQALSFMCSYQRQRTEDEEFKSLINLAA